MSKKIAILSAILTLAMASGAALAAEKPEGSKDSAGAKVTKHHMAQMHSDISKQCSHEADEKKLHGKERKEFRHKCMQEHSPKSAQSTKTKSANKSAELQHASKKKHHEASADSKASKATPASYPAKKAVSEKQS